MAITLFYAGLLTLWFFVLSVWVIRGREKDSVNLGDGGKPDMLRVIRGHANFAEYVPLILVLMAGLELSGLPALWMHGLGVALLISRLLHGIALSFTQRWFAGRVAGTFITLGLLVVLGVLSIVKAWPSLGVPSL